MHLNAIRRIKNRTCIIGILIAAYLTNIYGISLLSFLNSDTFIKLTVYENRLLSIGFSIFMIWVFVPNAFRYFKFHINGLGNKLTLILSITVILGTCFYSITNDVIVSQILQSLIFAMFIGIDEELLSRVFGYGLLERGGIEFALFLSSLIFGIAHFTNYFYADESLNYVLGHTLEAIGFGYLMAVLMILTGNIWLSITLHSIADLNLVSTSRNDYIAEVSGNSDWLVVFITTLLYVITARVLLAINSRKVGLPGSWERGLQHFGLIE